MFQAGLLTDADIRLHCKTNRIAVLVKSMPTTPFTTRIDIDLKAELERIAGHERRSASYMANLAIKNLVEERRATRELVALGLDMVRQDMPGIREEEVEAWLADDDERPFPEPHIPAS